MVSFLTYALVATLLPLHMPAQVPVQPVRVVDGDTIRVDLPCDLALVCDNQPVRVLGIDTPELRGKCDLEKERAHASKARLDQLLRAANTVALEASGKDRYGRLLARVIVDGQDVAAILIAEGHGRPYDGGKRAGWCA